MARIAELAYYPVKGLRGVSVGETEVLETGLRHDRERIAVGDEIRIDAWLPEGEDPGAIAHNARPGVRKG